MGWLSSVCSFVGDCIKSVGGALSSGIKAVGSALGGAFKTAVSLVKSLGNTTLGKLAMAVLKPLNALAIALGPVLGPIVAELIVRAVINILLKKLTEVKDEKVDEIGYRVAEAEKHEEWKKPQDFQSFKEYYEYLKQQIPDEKIDRQVLEENRYYYESVGISTLADEVGKKEGIETPVDFFIAAARSRMDETEVQAIIDAYKKLGLKSVDVHKYFLGKLDSAERGTIEAALMESLKVHHPNKTEDELENRLYIMERCSKSNVFMADEMYSNELKDINEHGEKSKYLKTE